ncbi:MAG: hypothetical protein HC871_02885 [Rhizobiales bacterium]|nr:hypothetical protein [Hyphomicrobiales bacterium]
MLAEKPVLNFGHDVARTRAELSMVRLNQPGWTAPATRFDRPVLLTTNSMRRRQRHNRSGQNHHEDFFDNKEIVHGLDSHAATSAPCAATLVTTAFRRRHFDQVASFLPSAPTIRFACAVTAPGSSPVPIADDFQVRQVRRAP